MKLIIIEGADGSGKSTLIEKARHECSTYFWSLRGMSRPPDDFDQIREIHYMLYRAGTGSIPLVCDRHPYISEPVYGPVLRGECRIPKKEYHQALDDFAFDTDRIIYCYPPVEVCFSGATKHPQLEGVIPKLQKLRERYEDVLRDLSERGVPILRYDWTNEKQPPLQDLLFGKPA